MAATRYFEDVTGVLTTTVFRDAHDFASTANLNVAPLIPGLPEAQAIVEIRAGRTSLLLLDFSASSNGIGSITFSGEVPVRIENYLWPRRNKLGRPKRFLSMRSAHGPRTWKDIAGNEYTWTVSPPAAPNELPTTYVCRSRDNLIVANYHPLPQAPPGETLDRPAAVLEIAAESTRLLPELVATLTIMRYLVRHPDAVAGVRL